MEKQLATISFKALSGAKDENPFAYLLFVDNFKILLDCGWTEDFDESQISAIKDVAPEIDAVLLSHCTMEHLGALPYLCQHCGLVAPIYATRPIVAFGSYVIYDCYRNIIEEQPFKLFNAADIETTFSTIKGLAYQEEVYLDNESIVIRPYRAGRSIGGTVWRIVKGENEILYTNSIYQGNDQIINGFEASSQWHPTLWIIDARGALEDERPPNIQEFVRFTAQKVYGGIVLVPVDGITRTFEILWHLNQYWERHKRDLSHFPIYYLSHSSKAIINTVNTFTEWLSDDIRRAVMKDSDTKTEAPLELKNIKKISSVDKLPSVDTPFVVVATSSTLMHGFSKNIFMNIGERTSSLIYFTTKQPKGTLADQLIGDDTHREIEIVTRSREELTGQELLDYKEEQDRLANVDDFEEEDDGDDENADEIIHTRSGTSSTVRSEFQFAARKKAPVGDYGSSINPQDYMKGVSREAQINEEVVIKMIQPTHKSNLEEPKEFPCKWMEVSRSFRYNATSRYCNFEARSTCFQIQQFLQKIPPAHIIIVGGTYEATMRLHDVIDGNLKTKISTPNVGEAVQLTLDQSSMKIGLSHALYNTLDFKKVDEFNEVAFLNAVVVNDDTSGYRSAKPVEEEQPHHATFVGEIRLAELRLKLVEAGIDVKGEGKLVCGKVEIRQIGENSISVEGPMCITYIKVRNVIQEHLLMV